jgi:O-antigen/teichoic acid export membrane protein
MSVVYDKDYILLQKISNNLRGLQQSSFINKLLVVMSGTFIAQLIGLAATPLITRLYTPEAFGYFSNVIAVAVIFSSILTLSYPLAIVLPKK